MRAGILLCVLGLTMMTLPARAAENVSFPGPGGVTLRAVLTKPPGRGPFPAVVALHGCGGMFSRSGKPIKRDHDWAQRLAAEGFLVLQPDSFGSRGLSSQCRTRNRVARASGIRPHDADAARVYLQTRPDVKPRAISLLGWSNGGSTVLYAVRPGMKDGPGPDFAKAVAFYPGCRVPMKHGWKTRLPLLILIGAADDWTPAAPCEEMARQARVRGEAVTIRVFPGAYHGFDGPGHAVHVLNHLAYTAKGDGAAHAGTDPAARKAALAIVPGYLAR